MHPLFSSSDSTALVQLWSLLPALIGGIALGWRNLTSGRGDRRAAARLALVVVLSRLAVALLRANHAADIGDEYRILEQGLSSALYFGVLVGLLYVGLEPYVRRVWPDHLISWSRLLTGRWRDARVARDLLVGLGAGILGTLMGFAQGWIGMQLDAQQAVPVRLNFPDAEGLPGMIARLCSQTMDGVWTSFNLLFLLMTLRLVVRRGWIAYVLVAPLLYFANESANPTGLPALDWTVALLQVALLLFLVARFGFFALAVGIATFYFLNRVPLTNDLYAWYGGQTIFAALLIGGLALYAAKLASPPPKLAMR